MEIEFSPSQLPAPQASSPVKPAATTSAASPPPALQGMAELQNKLDQLALTRQDKIDALRPVVTDVKYPPEQLLNGIAHLLAIKLSQ